MFCSEGVAVRRIPGFLHVILPAVLITLPVLGGTLDSPEIIIQFPESDLDGVPLTESLYSWLQEISAEYENIKMQTDFADNAYAFELVPGTAGDYAYIGWLLDEAGAYEEAIVLYGRALLMDGNNADFLSSRGRCHYENEQMVSAIADLERALEIDSMRIMDYAMLGRAYAETGDINGAFFCFTEGMALTMDPLELSTLHTERSMCYRLAGDYESAHVDLRQAIRLNPAAPLPHSRQGELFYLTLDDEDAIESFSRAIELGIAAERLVDCLFNRALAYIEVEDYQSAVSDITELLDQDPERTNAYYYRGLSYNQMGDAIRSRSDLEYFLRVGGDPELIPEAQNMLTGGSGRQLR